MCFVEPGIFIELKAAGNKTHKSLNLKIPQALGNRKTQPNKKKPTFCLRKSTSVKYRKHGAQVYHFKWYKLELIAAFKWILNENFCASFHCQNKNTKSVLSCFLFNKIVV